jgi:hypothetical protein
VGSRRCCGSRPRCELAAPSGRVLTASWNVCGTRAPPRSSMTPTSSRSPGGPRDGQSRSVPRQHTTTTTTTTTTTSDHAAPALPPRGREPSQVRATTRSHPRHARPRHASDGRTKRPIEPGHRDGVSRSGWLPAPAVATVLVFEYHVAGRGPVPGRLHVLNRNVRSARGALRKVVEDIRVWTLTATSWASAGRPCAARAMSRCHSTAVGR